MSMKPPRSVRAGAVEAVEQAVRHDERDGESVEPRRDAEAGRDPDGEPREGQRIGAYAARRQAPPGPVEGGVEEASHEAVEHAGGVVTLTGFARRLTTAPMRLSPRAAVEPHRCTRP